DHELVFRCHPLLPFELVQSNLQSDAAAFPNVSVSKRSASEDFRRSSVILYRGSSAVFYAVLEGLRPYYLHSGPFDIDPLFELDVWREYVTAESELASALKGYSEMKPEEVFDEWKAASDYVNSYTVPVSDKSIESFLSAANLT